VKLVDAGVGPKSGDNYGRTPRSSAREMQVKGSQATPRLMCWTDVLSFVTGVGRRYAVFPTGQADGRPAYRP